MQGALLTPRIGLGLTATLLAAALAGCAGDQTIVKTVTDQQSATAKPAAADAGGASDARVGDTLTLKGQETTLRVKVVDVLDPLPAGEFDEADAGKRFVGVKIVLENAGPAVFSDAVSNGSTIISKDNEQAEPTILAGGECSGSFASDVKIAAGDQRAGCIPFEVSSGAALRSFQFTPDSGFADATGEWRIASSGHRSAPAAGTSTPDAGNTGSVGGEDFQSCDANISAKVPSTSCEFAQNAFYEYFEAGRASSISVYSPATGQTYATSCIGDAQITCTTPDGGTARFSSAAIDAYSEDQASKYAASHDTGE